MSRAQGRMAMCEDKREDSHNMLVIDVSKQQIRITFLCLVQL